MKVFTVFKKGVICWSLRASEGKDEMTSLKAGARSQGFHFAASAPAPHCEENADLRLRRRDRMQQRRRRGRRRELGSRILGWPRWRE